MRFEIDFWPGTPEAQIIGSAILALGNIKREAKDQDASPVNETKVVTNETTQAISEALTAPRVRPRRKAAAAEVVAAVDPVATAAVATEAPVSVVETLMGIPDAPVPVPLGPLTTAAKVYAKEEIENMVRAKARTDFEAMAGLLKEYGVARFGLLDASKHQEFAAKLALLA